MRDNYKCTKIKTKIQLKSLKVIENQQKLLKTIKNRANQENKQKMTEIIEKNVKITRK